jgi:endoglucanase
MKAFIQKLVETPGPPGYETAVRQVVRQAVEPYSAAIQEDGLGSLIVRYGAAQPGGRRVLVLAQLDEPGLIASHVDRDGFVRSMPLGDLQPAVCAGQRVRFLNGACGVVGYPASAAAEALTDLDSLFIDLGAANGEAAPVRPGDVAVFEGPFIDLGARMSGKALGTRLGVAVAVEVLRRLHAGPQATPHEVVFAFIAQGQVGLRGAGTTAFQVAPELVISLTATAGDLPGPGRPALRLGDGPVIRVRDMDMLSDPRVTGWMTNVAQTADIPFQTEISTAPTTSARLVQVGGEGAAAGVLAVAGRYLGSPVELVDSVDVERLADLLHALLLAPAPF